MSTLANARQVTQGYTPVTRGTSMVPHTLHGLHRLHAFQEPLKGSFFNSYICITNDELCISDPLRGFENRVTGVTRVTGYLSIRKYYVCRLHRSYTSYTWGCFTGNNPRDERGMA